MIGHVPAAPDFVHGNATRCEQGRLGDDVLPLGRAPLRQDRRVLEQQHRVADVARDPLGLQLFLKEELAFRLLRDGLGKLRQEGLTIRR